MRQLIAALFLTLIVSPAFAKSLHWRSFDVTAKLDADGRLHVREQQSMVFDGDWNGGERRFNIRPGQSLDFERIVRVENGRDIPLTRGDLSQVDHWDFVGNDHLVRWRSRLPSDPPFQSRELTYALEYVLSNILVQTSRGAHLHHDFAFSDRAGVIENFSLHLDIDPVWRGLTSPLEIHKHNLVPGESVIEDADLVYSGSGHPAAVHVGTSPAHAAMIVVLLLIAGVALTWKLYVDEKHKGRFGPLFPTAAINEQWLQRYVFALPPEAVGAAWDEQTGAAEVGAVIARMEQEKKLTTWVTHDPALFGEKTALHLKLNVDWTTLPHGEQQLMQALFLGKTETDTNAIKEYYSSKGFQPEKLISDLIEGELARVSEWNVPAGPVSAAEIIVFLLALISGAIAFDNAQGLRALLIAADVIAVFGFGAALVARRRVDRSPWPPIVFAWFVIVIAAIDCFFAVQLAVADLVTFMIALAAGCAAAAILLVSRSREAIPKIAFRRRLAAARNYFTAQLRSRNPNLRDAWYPYLVALGLGPNVDQWFKHYSGASTAVSGLGSRTSSFGSTSSSSSTWTGGGGAFGGAGASGSWAAMSAVASGVAAPSSGGGGGGGGGGGSGGGGGGGW